MSIKALLAARTKIRADPLLRAYFIERYGRDARHFIGYKKVQNANDYPAICYVPVSSSEPISIGGMSNEQVSLVIGIYEPDIIDDVFNGVLILSVIETMVLDCLNTGELGPNSVYLGKAKTTTDMGSRHPFYELEIAMPLAAR